jgi:hypothetical protein
VAGRGERRRQGGWKIQRLGIEQGFVEGFHRVGIVTLPSPAPVAMACEMPAAAIGVGATTQPAVRPATPKGRRARGAAQRRRSSVNGNSRLPGTSMVAAGVRISPGVWPVRVKRDRRRLSAS